MPKEITQEQKSLYNSIKNDVKRANQRLVRLEREFGEDSWASKRLATRLDTDKLKAFTNQGRIRLNQSMSVADMLAIKKATEQFLGSKTSTVKGAKMKLKEIKLQIKKAFSTEEDVISDEDVEDFLDIVQDIDYKALSPYIKASDFFALINDAKEKNMSKKEFVDELDEYATISNDADLKQKAIRLLNKYGK